MKNHIVHNPTLKNTVVAASCILAMSLPLAALADDSSHAVGVTANSFGLGASYTYKLNERFHVRGIVTGIADNESKAEYSDLDYEGELDSSSAGVMLNWYPFQSGWANRAFVTGGLLYSKYQYEGSAQAKFGDSIVVGGSAVNPGDIDSLDVTIESKAQVSPYVGIGWGNKVKGKRGVAFIGELGFTYLDDPDVSLDAKGNGGSVSQASLDAERKSITRDVEGGVVGYGSVGVAYHF